MGPSSFQFGAKGLEILVECQGGPSAGPRGFHHHGCQPCSPSPGMERGQSHTSSSRAGALKQTKASSMELCLLSRSRRVYILPPKGQALGPGHSEGHQLSPVCSGPPLCREGCHREPSEGSHPWNTFTRRNKCHVKPRVCPNGVIAEYEDQRPLPLEIFSKLGSKEKPLADPCPTLKSEGLRSL